ncbi:MAG: response regulator [Alphaproteobacteria bacterium]|nr:response regulator [Alphaproteobacteria bacterium]
MRRPSVLLVEDEFLIRLTLAEALADEGFDVIEAENSAEALALLRAHPDLALLLTDLHLADGLSGAELAHAARQVAPQLPVIFMSGRPDSAPAMASAPGAAFVAKPYHPIEVCSLARRLTQD